MATFADAVGTMLANSVDQSKIMERDFGNTLIREKKVDTVLKKQNGITHIANAIEGYEGNNAAVLQAYEDCLAELKTL